MLWLILYRLILYYIIDKQRRKLINNFNVSNFGLYKTMLLIPQVMSDIFLVSKCLNAHLKVDEIKRITFEMPLE